MANLTAPNTTPVAKADIVEKKAVGDDIEEVGATAGGELDEVVDAAEERRRRRALVISVWEKLEIKKLQDKMQEELGVIDSWKAAHKVYLENEILRLQKELEEVDGVAEVRRSSAKDKFDTECARIKECAARMLVQPKAKWFGCFGV